MRGDDTTREPPVDRDSEASLTRDDTGGDAVHRSSIQRNLFHMLNAQLVTWTIAMLLTVIVPRYLGPELVGRFRLATSLWTLGRIAVMAGTTKFLQLEIARDQKRGLRLVGPVLIVRSGVFVVVSLVLAVYALASDQGEVFRVLMIIVGVDSLLFVWSEALGNAFIGLERMATPALVSVITRFTMAVVTIAAVLMGADVYVIAAASGVGAALSIIVLVARLRPLTPIIQRGDARPWRQVLSASAPFMLIGGALVLYQQIDIVVISWTANDAALGWYGTADSLFGSLLFPASILTATIFPTLGRLNTDDPEGMRRIIERAFSLLVLLAVPIGLGTLLVAPTFAPLLFGDDFAETGTVLAILGPVIILTFGTILFGTVAQTTGRVRYWTSVLLAAALLTIPLDLVLVPWADDRFDNGAIGGAVAYLITESLQFGIGLIVIAPFLLSRTVSWRILRTLAAGAVMFVAGWPLREMFVAVPAVVCGAVYVVCVFAFRLVTDGERSMLRGVLARAGGRRGSTG